MTVALLRTHDMQAAKTLFEALGLTFVQEQHGSGPVHYACEVGDTVFEIYPARDGGPEPLEFR